MDASSFFTPQNPSAIPTMPSLRGWPVTVSVEGIGFSYQLTNDDLYKVFSRYGCVTHVEIMMPDGNSANVFFSSYDEASRAIASLDGKELAGVKGHLRVSWGQFPTGPNNLSNSDLTGQGIDPMRKFTCRFEIGIENDKDFQVARRIIGQKGVNMKNIVSRTDAKLRLRGRGSGYLEGLSRQESPEPLHLCVSCTTRRGYTEAARLVSELLERVYDDFRHYCSITGLAYPSNLRVTIREHPLGSGSYPPFEETNTGSVNSNVGFGEDTIVFDNNNIQPSTMEGLKHFGGNAVSVSSTTATTTPIVSSVFMATA